MKLADSKKTVPVPWWGWVLIVVAALVVIPALSSGGDSEDERTAAEETSEVAPEPESEPEPEPETSSEPEFTCLEVTDRLFDAINSGVKDVDPGNSITKAAAVKAPNLGNAWFIAAEIAGTGIEPGQAQGVWVSNYGVEDDDFGLLFSVDGIAEEFSTWGSTDGTDFEVSPSESGVEEARLCLSYVDAVAETATEAPEDPCDTGKLGNMWVLIASEGCIDPWPVTSESGILYCDPMGEGVGAVVWNPDEDPGTFYAVNGMATTIGYPEIDPIWKDNTSGTGGPKVSIGALLDAGLSLCEV